MNTNTDQSQDQIESDDRLPRAPMSGLAITIALVVSLLGAWGATMWYLWPADSRLQENTQTWSSTAQLDTVLRQSIAAVEQRPRTDDPLSASSLVAGGYEGPPLGIIVEVRGSIADGYCLRVAHTKRSPRMHGPKPWLWYDSTNPTLPEKRHTTPPKGECAKPGDFSTLTNVND